LRNSQNAQFVKYQHDPDDPSTISSNIINSLHCGERNELWIGTSSYLEKLDLNTGTFTKISDVIANSILQDKSGHFWIATPSDGLFQMNAQGQVLKDFNGLGDLSLSTVSNLLNPIILGMARHPDSTIWITTNEGLSIFDPAGNMFSHFTLDDLNQSGLSLHSVNILTSGEVLIGGVDGFNIITPDRLNSSHQINEVLITDLKVGGRSVLYDLNNDGFQGHLKREENHQTLTLSHQERALSISYSVIEYNAPDKINFAYRLEGFEDEWNYTSAHFRQAQYPGLPPGSYQLWLKATNSRGEWGKAAVKLKIVVTPPYWATWWFRLLFAIAMGALIVLLVRLRTRQLHLHQKNLQKLIDHKTAELSKKGEQLQLQNLELQSQKNEILRISEQIKQANENKMEFFTSISHEFRTPLTLILGPIEQLKARIRESDKREVGHFLTTIEKNGFRLLRLINDILDFRKIDTGNMKIICVKADIMPFLDHLIEAFREIASRKAIELSFEKSTHGYECWFDPGKLEIICFNLLSNAFHYTPSGGKVTLVVNIDDRKKCISLEVRDTGIGMNESELDHVFNRFYQVGNGISDSKGSGIGLSLTKDVVEIQRGHITVHSLPEKGTTFSVELPMFDPENEDNQNVVFNKFGSPEPNLGLAANLTGELNAAGSSPVKPPKSAAKRQDVILIVEDDLDMQRYLQSCLEHTYKILLASNGEEGLEIAKKEQPHLILSDVMMPKMTGPDLCQKVKQDFTISHIPVVLLSAQTAYETQLDGYDKGADGFIGKPFHQGLLLAKLGSVLASKERLFLKFKNEKILEPSEITVTSVDEEFVTRAKEIVEKNMDNSDFEVQDMISELGMSRTLLHMKLKKLMNCSTTDFIRGLRMKRASQLLRSGNYRVAEVCYMVGYNDPQNFSKVFRQHFGQTPSDHKSQQT
ncbi:MAG: response regulator, partial [Marinoscillum sp.]